LFALEGGEMDGVLRFTAAGLGVAVVPSLVIDPASQQLKAVRLAEPLTRTIAFANRRDRRLSRAGREFVETVRGLVRGRHWLRARPPGLTVLEAKS
jgi:DNA-binding transcriptional LysR family regulator